MSKVIDSLERAQLRHDVPAFDAGDRVKVHFQVVEGTRRRTQIFEGVVLRRQGTGARETFTVRKQSFGVGVERTFPVHSPKVERIEVASRGEVRRAKLYYLRGRVGRGARIRERQYTGPGEAPVELVASDDQGSQEEAEVVPRQDVPEAEEGAAAEGEPGGAEGEAGDAEGETGGPEGGGAGDEAGGAEGEAAEEPPVPEPAAEAPPQEEPPADEPPAEDAEDAGGEPERS